MWSQSKTMKSFIAYNRIWCLFALYKCKLVFLPSETSNVEFLNKAGVYVLMHAYLRVCVCQCAHTVILYDCVLASGPDFLLVSLGNTEAGFCQTERLSWEIGQEAFYRELAANIPNVEGFSCSCCLIQHRGGKIRLFAP